MSDSNGFEWLRVVTPVLTGICLFITSLIYSEISQVREMVLQHITNHEIHIPKSEIVELKHNGRENIKELQKFIEDKFRAEYLRKMDSDK